MATMLRKYLFLNKDLEGRRTDGSVSGRSSPSYIVSSDHPVFSSDPHSWQASAFRGVCDPQFGQKKYPCIFQTLS
ncbi:hypothetical protein [Candidatus Kuenenia stuttgartiensis]|uniref:hypothetical protein n=1 Tax=Kuenenia stuttgartiensis TaxID=174633 RepID=UPI00146A8B36|nr:hypothetical protein [Candidatus Kuenenia stuttgartiensis]